MLSLTMLSRSGPLRVLLFGLIVGLQAELMPPKGRELLLQVAAQQGSRTEYLKAFESRLLSMFGLKSRPKPRRGIKIPQYMLDLYHQHARNTDLETDSLDLPDKHTGLANVVRSHTHQETRAEEVHAPNSMHLFFNISSLQDSEQVKVAELRIFRRGVKPLPYSNKSSSKLQLPTKQRIHVYDVIRPAIKQGEALLRLVDTRVVDIRKSEWESFDVLPAVLRWKELSSANHGLYVQVTALDGRETPLEHVRLKRSAKENDSWLQEEQPLLVTHSDNNEMGRFRRAARKYRRKGRKDNSCKRHSLFVDFKDVGWNDWIVAPPGYDAYFCHGDCQFPLADHLNSTNHAIVQTIVNSVNPKAVPRSCCVPTELSPISMLYVDEYEKVVLKNYHDMIVVACGCR